MRPTTILLMSAVALLVALFPAYGQTSPSDQKSGTMQVTDKQSHDAGTITSAQPEVPLKIQVVFTESEGTKKISSLPYTMYGLSNGRLIQLRYDDYMHGFHDRTQIDCNARREGADSYRMDFGFSRGWIRGLNGKESSTGTEQSTEQPSVIPDFSNEFSVIAKDGQTVEGASAVDPLTGHVLKVAVTLTVLK
jgi:hypothetical protein